VALCQDRLIAGVVQDELPVREALVELIPVMVERRAMLVVLGPDLIGQAGDGVPEFRALAVADNLRAHATSIPRAPPGWETLLLLPAVAEVAASACIYPAAMCVLVAELDGRRRATERDVLATEG